VQFILGDAELVAGDAANGDPDMVIGEFLSLQLVLGRDVFTQLAERFEMGRVVVRYTDADGQ